jgi:O-antigen ligase
MNPPGIPGGAMNFTPLWHPPVSVKWIGTGLIVFAGAVADRIQPRIRKAFTTPLGFFLSACVALAIFEYGFPPAAFAVLFFLLMVWSSHVSAAQENFINGANTIDWVINDKKWYVEKVLKETPVAIQDKDVSTYPVAGQSAQAGTAAGNT